VISGGNGNLDSNRWRQPAADQVHSSPPPPGAAPIAVRHPAAEERALWGLATPLANARRWPLLAAIRAKELCSSLREYFRDYLSLDRCSPL
jgi:hypothetical protein